MGMLIAVAGRATKSRSGTGLDPIGSSLIRRSFIPHCLEDDPGSGLAPIDFTQEPEVFEMGKRFAFGHESPSPSGKQLSR